MAISPQTRATLREAWQQTSDEARLWIEQHIQQDKNGNPNAGTLLTLYAKRFKACRNGVTAWRYVTSLTDEQLEIDPTM